MRARQKGTCNTLTVQVTDDGVPPLSAVTGFKVTVKMLAITVEPTDGGFQITFPTTAGRKYRIEFTDDLGLPAWQTLDSELDGTGGQHSVDIAVLPDVPQRFYRVVEVP